MKKILLPFFATALLVTLFNACKKDDNGEAKLQIRLTDAPAVYDEVNVDIREVRVNLRNDSTGWVSLATNAGVYDLLSLQNGVDTLLASGNVPGNVLKEIRLFLGPNNTVKVNGQVYPLLMNSGDNPKLKIKVDKDLNATLNSIVVDFDAGLSIREEGNGSYRLIPVLKIK
ncbi:MAG: DUF4382 domain-containing protein [Dinghuibacter sp.]|nr:DUF4382 domain-containing protein [Dinghuibacter sp.]